MSHAQILNLLHREADQMSGYGYGYGMECPHCEGSGLIGGFAGQKSFSAALNDLPLKVSDRKKYRQQALELLNAEQKIEMKPRKKLTANDRVEIAREIIKRGGLPKPKIRAPVYDTTSVGETLARLKITPAQAIAAVLEKS